jgi:ssDNA-binding Zn-finger/Zn-ribbon topoisomerase 1
LSQLIRVKPEPSCPKCGAPMKLRRPKPDDTWKLFWGCGRYPQCDGTAKPVTKLEDQPSFWEEKEIVYERI